MGTLVDLTGKKYGRLVALERAGSTAKKKATWLCRCDCGRMLVVVGSNLTSGNTQSCGCFDRDINSRVHTTHGGNRPGKRERLYSVWLNMRGRCTNPSRPDYKYYGGCGVEVCEEWSDYSKFRSWAFANGYDPAAPHGQCTIDRINVNGNYCPENCRWVDMKTQRHNRRDCMR